MLGRADRPRRLAAGRWDAGVGRGHKFVEDSVVVGEEPAEGVVIATAAEMDRGNEIHLDRLPSGAGGILRILTVFHDRGVERNEAAIPVSGEAEKLCPVGHSGSGRLANRAFDRGHWLR